MYIYFTHINTVVSVVNTELSLKVKRTMLMMLSIDLVEYKIRYSLVEGYSLGKTLDKNNVLFKRIVMDTITSYSTIAKNFLNDYK